MRLIGHSISTAAFHYNAETRTFVADISELRGFNPFSQVFDDAADVGFVMESEKTGNRAAFCLTKTDHNNDGEVTGWRFLSYKPAGISCLIIND